MKKVAGKQIDMIIYKDCDKDLENKLYSFLEDVG